MQQQWRMLFLVHVRILLVDDITTQGTRKRLSDSTLRMMTPAYVGLISGLLPGISHQLPLPVFSLQFEFWWEMQQ